VVSNCPTLVQHILKERVEPVDDTKRKQSLDVARENRIEPLAMERRILLRRQQRGRRTAVIEPLRRGRAERGEFARQRGDEMQQPFPSGQRVAEFFPDARVDEANAARPRATMSRRRASQALGSLLRVI